MNKSREAGNVNQETVPEEEVKLRERLLDLVLTFLLHHLSYIDVSEDAVSKAGVDETRVSKEIDRALKSYESMPDVDMAGVYKHRGDVIEKYESMSAEGKKAHVKEFLAQDVVDALCETVKLPASAVDQSKIGQCVVVEVQSQIKEMFPNSSGDVLGHLAGIFSRLTEKGRRLIQSEEYQDRWLGIIKREDKNPK